MAKIDYIHSRLDKYNFSLAIIYGWFSFKLSKKKINNAIKLNGLVFIIIIKDFY